MTEGPYKLPEGWRWVRLGDVARIFSGSPAPQDKRYFEEGSMPFVRVQDLGRYGITTNLTETSDKVNGEAVKELRLVKANKGTILFPKSGAAILTNSRAILGEDAYIVSHLAAVEPFHDVLETLWAFYWLCTVDMGRYIDNPAYPSLRLSKIRELLIPLPPLEEQRRIVARVEELMSRIREAKRLRQEAKEEAERLWQSILSETFPKPGSELPKGWRWVRLGDVCEYRTGIWGPEASDPTQGFPIIRSTEIEGLLIRPQTASVRMVRRGQVDAYKLETGDILINKSSGSPHLVGWPAIFEDPRDGKIYLFSNFMLRLRADRRTLEPWFLLYYLHSPTARSIYLGAQDTTSGLRNLRVREFMVQPIPLPPLEEQRCIVAYFQDVQEKIRALKEAQAQTEAELKRLEQAILDKAFRGEL
jgi:type I restriction enzyme S subunit